MLENRTSRRGYVTSLSNASRIEYRYKAKKMNWKETWQRGIAKKGK
jgi:hypothetical protein